MCKGIYVNWKTQNWKRFCIITSVWFHIANKKKSQTKNNKRPSGHRSEEVDSITVFRVLICQLNNFTQLMNFLYSESLIFVIAAILFAAVIFCYILLLRIKSDQKKPSLLLSYSHSIWKITQL